MKEWRSRERLLPIAEPHFALLTFLSDSLESSDGAHTIDNDGVVRCDFSSSKTFYSTKTSR